MSTAMFYTKANHIPVFKVIFLDDGQEPLLEFYNPRTKTYERMTVSSFHAELNRLIFQHWPSDSDGS